MLRFLLPLFAGFFFAGASAFTAAWSRRWGDSGGRLASALLRNLLGIPLYFLGLLLAWRSSAPLLTETGGAGLGLGSRTENQERRAGYGLSRFEGHQSFWVGLQQTDRLGQGHVGPAANAKNNDVGR